MIFHCGEEKNKNHSNPRERRSVFAVYLNILSEGSDVQERYLDGSSHLFVGCIHEHFQRINPILIVLPQLVYLVCSCILPVEQRKTEKWIVLIEKSN